MWGWTFDKYITQLYQSSNQDSKTTGQLIIQFFLNLYHASIVLAMYFCKWSWLLIALSTTFNHDYLCPCSQTSSKYNSWKITLRLGSRWNPNFIYGNIKRLGRKSKLSTNGPFRVVALGGVMILNACFGGCLSTTSCIPADGYKEILFQPTRPAFSYPTCKTPCRSANQRCLNWMKFPTQTCLCSNFQLKRKREEVCSCWICFTWCVWCM